MDVRDEYIKTVDRLIDRFEFLRRSGVYFIPVAPSGAPAKPTVLQTSGNPASGLLILCDDDAAPESATGKLLADILKAMKFGPEEVFVISGVKSASSGEGQKTVKALIKNELSKLSPKVIVAFGQTSANALAGLAQSESAMKIRQAPSIEDMLGNKDLKRKAWADLQAVMKEFDKGPA